MSQLPSLRQRQRAGDEAMVQRAFALAAGYQFPARTNKMTMKLDSGASKWRIMAMLKVMQFQRRAAHVTVLDLHGAPCPSPCPPLLLLPLLLLANTAPAAAAAAAVAASAAADSFA